jgi:hypothetical protein
VNLATTSGGSFRDERRPCFGRCSPTVLSSKGDRGQGQGTADRP